MLIYDYRYYLHMTYLCTSSPSMPQDDNITFVLRAVGISIRYMVHHMVLIISIQSSRYVTLIYIYGWYHIIVNLSNAP